jgi:Ni/Co efflux regulator RcnB
MKKLFATLLLVISLAGTFVVAEGYESQSKSQIQVASSLNNSPNSAFVQRRWRRWRRWRRHERRERRHERRQRRRERRHNM